MCRRAEAAAPPAPTTSPTATAATVQPSAPAASPDSSCKITHAPPVQSLSPTAGPAQRPAIAPPATRASTWPVPLPAPSAACQVVWIVRGRRPASPAYWDTICRAPLALPAPTKTASIAPMRHTAPNAPPTTSTTPPLKGAPAGRDFGQSLTSAPM